MGDFTKQLNEAIDKAMSKIDTPKFQKEWDERQRKMYEDEKQNPNEFRNWYPKLCNTVYLDLNATFKIPYSQIIEMPFEWWNWIWRDSYKEEDIAKFGKYFEERIEDRLKQNKMFIKSGVFSNKFVFNNCIVKPNDLDKLGLKFLNIQYGAMCVLCPVSTDLIVREFIESGNKKTIYEGMKLNTEFRVFYDFDKNEIIGVVNYWDRNYVGENLYDPQDKIVFDQTIDEIEKTYKEKEQELKEKVNRVFKGQEEFTGKYSIDFMYVDGDFWIIDMALAENSAYCEKFNLR